MENSTFKSNQQGKKNARPSKEQRGKSFRQKKNAETVAAVEAETVAKLGLPAEETRKIMESLQTRGSTQASKLPVTTRGVGFLINECFNKAVKEVPKIEPVANPFQFYRTSLAQIDLQIERGLQRNTLHFDSLSFKHQVPNIDDIESQIMSSRQNFKPVANLVNTLGSYVHSSKNFATVVPDIEEIDGGTKISAEELSTGTKRKAAEEPVTYKLDPYLITFSNLKETVRNLSDPNCPVRLRKRFVENNPIPGAVFKDNLLQNPDDIIKQDYNFRDFINDCRDVDAIFSTLATKAPHFVSNVNLDGKGNSATLTNSLFLKMRIDGIGVECDLQDTYRANQHLEDGELLLGALNLTGEVPKDAINNAPFACRTPDDSVKSITIGWADLVSHVIRKRVS